MASNGIPAEIADAIFAQLAAFANFGFPESHAVSFAYLVYASAWFKLHYPGAFLAALLNSQPMGFWSPQSLTQDARRHGVVIESPLVNRSGVEATLEPDPSSVGGMAVRLGIGSVRGIGTELATRIADGAPYGSIDEVARRSGAPRPALEALATAGAFDKLPALEGGGSAPHRREALWAAGALADAEGRLPGLVVGANAPPLPTMSPIEETVADLWATGVTAALHPFSHFRDSLASRGVLCSTDLLTHPPGKVLVAGIVTHRQRPSTAGGTVFLNLEDESGTMNIICSRGFFLRYREAATSPAVVVRGRLERVAEAVTIVAEHIEHLELPITTGRSRDFR
jgi:error-prone DNA polymerase